MTITATGNRMTTEIARQAKLAQDIAKTQISISTTKRFQSASEDPLAAARVAQLNIAKANDTTWKNNLNLGASLASQADVTLASLSSGMLQANDLMIAGASNTASAADRATYAAQLRDLATQVDSLRSTTTSLGTPLFSTGTATAFRVDNGTTIAPAASAATVFDRSGVSLSDDLRNAALALESGNQTQINTALSRIGTAVDHVANAAADQGVRGAQIDRLIDSNAARSIDTEAERSGLEDTDIQSAIAKLNSQQLTLEAAQAAFARLNRRTLFDILS
ncbi:MAG: flagellin [Pseudomonadota bacterium]